MTALLPDVDPDGLLEFSVVFTDRSLNHMSQQFQQVMRDLSTTLKGVYNADSVAIVPGGGTYAMESVARQLATDEKVMVVRNGWFSFRWTQIFEAGNIPSEHTVLMARQQGNDPTAPFAPVPIAEAVQKIKEERPAVLFAPHVETSSGVILPDDYIQALADAVHSVGGLLVLDCIASGCIWIDMDALGVDVLISAPQKGWSASPCAGLVMMNAAAREKVASRPTTTFANSLQSWTTIMEAYENGGHAYHATMPTDPLKTFRDVTAEMQDYGFDRLKAAQQALGDGVRALMARRGFRSVAADGFGAPGVVVCLTDDGGIQNGSKFAAQGVQIAAGVPLRCNEPEGYSSFRIGLFGLDKLYNVEATIARLDAAFDAIS